MIPGKDANAIKKRYEEMTIGDGIPAAPAVSGGSSKLRKKHHKENLKSILKDKKKILVEDVDSDEGEPVEIAGRDVIRVDLTDGLTESDVRFSFMMPGAW